MVGGKPLTYRSVGVDHRAVARSLGSFLRAVHPPRPRGHGRLQLGPGHFSGLVRVGKETLALTTDGVGTKVLLAERMGRWEEVGEDLVAVNVNDLSAVGARPLALLDYLAVPRPDPRTLRAIGRGLGRGLRKAGCGLVGGETAVVPELHRAPDLSGTALGYFPPGRSPVTGERLRPGDVVLGLPSSGFHANGYTLVRRLVQRAGLPLGSPLPEGGASLGRRLLSPSRIYTRAVEALLAQGLPVGLAHMTGGGVRNLNRLNPRVGFLLDRWPDPSGIFRWVSDLSGLDPEELYQTFNMGVGFVVVVRARSVDRALAVLARAGERPVWVLGKVVDTPGVHLPAHGVRYEGY